MNPINRFTITYFIYIQITFLMFFVMTWIETPPEKTSDLIWLSLSTFLAFGALILALVENQWIRKNPDAALRRLLKTVQYYPSLSKQQLINKLTIQYPFVPAKVFLQAFEQAIAKKYIGSERE